MNIRRILTVILFLTGIVFFFWFYQNPPMNIQIGKKAPSFSLHDYSGNPVSLDDFSGKVIFLNFWATWCPPCLVEMPSIEKLHQQFYEKGLVVLGLSESGSGEETNVKRLREKIPLSFPLLNDWKSEVSDRYGVSQLPLTVVIDRQGIVFGIYRGATDWGEPDSLEMIKTLLQ